MFNQTIVESRLKQTGCEFTRIHDKTTFRELQDLSHCEILSSNTKGDLRSANLLGICDLELEHSTAIFFAFSLPWTS